MNKILILTLLSLVSCASERNIISSKTYLVCPTDYSLRENGLCYLTRPLVSATPIQKTQITQAKRKLFTKQKQSNKISCSEVFTKINECSK